MSVEYEALADVYDALAYDQPADRWTSYLLSLCGNEVRTVLEYACGTGRITQELVKAGKQVTAVDKSAKMLAAAANKLRRPARTCRLVEEDMAMFRLATPVDAAVCACDGVNYLTSSSELAMFFSNAFANLRHGGTFLFDVSTCHKLRDVLADEFYYDDGETETLFWQNAFDPATSLCEMTLTIFRAAGELYERFDETHVQRAWTSGELRRALHDAGFEDVSEYAFGTRNLPDAETQRIQFCSVKR